MARQRLCGMDKFHTWETHKEMTLVFEVLYSHVIRIDIDEGCNQTAIA